MTPIRSLAALAALSALLAGAARADAPERVHHTLQLTLTPQAHRLEATDRIELTGSGTLDLQLRPELEVARLTVDGAEREPARDGARLTVDLGGSGRHTVTLAYAGTLNVGHKGSGVGPSIAPAGTVLPPETGWLPRGAADRITYEVTLDVPAKHRALVTGKRVSQGVADGRRTAVYRADYPSSGPAVFAGPYAETARTVGDVTLRTLFPEDRDKLARTYLDKAARYLRHYEEIIGPYPYPAFGVVAAPFPVGLGFEGATYVSRRILGLPYMQGRSLAHEILHSWWGGAVAIAYETGNWAEGLTTYQADHWLAAETSPKAAAELRRQWLRDVAALPESRQQPLDAFTGKLHDADQVTGYNKAAMVFHMLRRRLGEEAFAAGLAGFYEAQRFDTAGWADLQRAFEAASGSDLDRFFAQWLTRQGAPAVRLAKAERRQTADGWSLALTLEQDPPAYDLRVPVEIATPYGTSRLTVPLDRRRVHQTVTLDAAPRALAVDPHHDVFRALPPAQVPLVLRALTLDPATRVVVAGRPETPARQLAGRLLDTPAEPITAEAAAADEAPLLVIGETDKVAQVMADAGFGAAPETVAGRGDLRAWTAEADGRRALAVAADDPAALRRGARALPHYLRASWLVLKDGRLVERGVWPTAADPLRVTFGG